VSIKTTLKTSVAAAALFAVAVPVAEAGTVSNGNGNSVTLSGQVNKAVYYADDGKASRTAVGDNDNSGTRFRILGKGKVNEALSVGTAFEVEFQDNALNNFSIDDSTAAGGGGAGDSGFGQSTFNQRRAEAYFSHKQFGKLSIGQGPTASDGTAETSLSGAGMAAGGGFMFNGNGISIRTANQTGASATFGGTTWGEVVGNLDGLSRNDRVRYDTPSFGGFSLATSVLSDGRADVADRFSGKMGGIAVKAAASYVNTSGGSTADDNQYVVSAAAEHESGLNVRGQYGKASSKVAGTDGQSTWSIGVGYDAKLSSMGDTSFAASYTVDSDVLSNGGEATYYDFGVVQHMKDAGTELYAGVSFFEYDDSTATNYEDLTTVIVGTRIKF